MSDTNSELQAAQKLLEQENYELAFKVLLPFAEAGIMDAEATIGVLYMLGQGTARDLQKAIFFLKRAVEKGSGIAAHNLGTLYLTCEPDMPLNREESRRWFKVASDLGFHPGTK